MTARSTLTVTAGGPATRGRLRQQLTAAGDLARRSHRRAASSRNDSGHTLELVVVGLAVFLVATIVVASLTFLAHRFLGA